MLKGVPDYKGENQKGYKKVLFTWNKLGPISTDEIFKHLYYLPIEEQLHSLRFVSGLKTKIRADGTYSGLTLAGRPHGIGRFTSRDGLIDEG